MEPVKISLAKNLARSIGIGPEVTVEATTLGQALRIWASRLDMKDVVFGEDGRVQPFLRIFVDQALVAERSLEDLEKIPVSGRSIDVRTAFAGG